ncbi:7f2a3a80-d853-4b31-a24e-9a927013fc22 [Sclerotinia trifoliorum]|uniref:7f2a3a80-d853-4b31-a24e-9a927013fc22 n=1 Tax=Sclerotinia trifoliorum TaxID=28548 RepID=A0A8H2VZ69_9HELO|nr:7f2a3a80-d853-4b31-a24e-9a927013fc22 [Sclerotinia trifoliorum]
MAPSKQHRYDSSPSPRARGNFSANDNNTGSDGVGWGARAARTPVDNWIKRILDDDGNDGEDPSVDIEGVTRDIGKLREEEANGTGRGWDTDLEFTTRSMDFNHSPRLKTAGIPSRIEEIMENERSFAEDDVEEEEDGEANAVKAREEPARKDKFVVKPESQKLSQTAGDETGIRETVRAKSQERRDRLRKELKQRREERRPITSYETEDNKISQERQEGVLRNRLPRERRARSGDFSRNDPVHVEIPIRSLRNNKENVMPREEKPLSRLERRFQGQDGLKAIQRARENRLRHDHNQRVPEDNETRLRIENSRTALENLEPRSFERAENNGEIGQMHEKTILEEEGEVIHGTPITVFSGNERRPNGPNSKQEDSLQILRNLSKAITGTNGSGGDSTGRSDNDPQARILAERSPFELEHASEKFANSAPTPPPSAPIDPLLLPTPKVTGGWIETPAPPRMRTNDTTLKEEPSSPRRNSELSKSSQSHSHSRTRPTPINSAPTVSAAADLQRIEKEARVDDSTTIDRDFSLFLTNQPTSPAPDTIEINLETDESGKPLSHEEKRKRLDELAFHRMNRSLKHTTSSIRDARHGIERLEQQVASSGSHSHSPRELGIPTQKTLSRPFFLDSPPDPVLNPNVHYLMIPIPRLRYPGTKKFTWFGLFFTIFITWFVAEWAMCETYCHPKYSNKDIWHPSDPFWPWAIPTKLDQWTGKVVSARMEDVWDWWQGYDEEIRIWKEEMAKRQEIKMPKIVEVGNDEEVVDKSWTKGSGDKGGSSWWNWDNDEAV